MPIKRKLSIYSKHHIEFHVHDELRRRQRGQRSVSEIALDWGFSHFGQFAQDYRHLFGELPSETLRTA